MLSRFWNLFRRKRLDRELDAELRYHVDSLEAEYRYLPSLRATHANPIDALRVE